MSSVLGRNRQLLLHLLPSINCRRVLCRQTSSPILLLHPHNLESPEPIWLSFGSAKSTIGRINSCPKISRVKPPSLNSEVSLAASFFMRSGDNLKDVGSGSERLCLGGTGLSPNTSYCPLSIQSTLFVVSSSSKPQAQTSNRSYVTCPCP